MTITEDAHAALWRTICGLDLVVARIEERQHPADPLRLMLTDYRLARTTTRSDRLWLRIMDVPAELSRLVNMLLTWTPSSRSKIRS